MSPDSLRGATERTSTPVPRPRTGLLALSVFFAFGAIIASVTAIAVLSPGGRLDTIWRLNPQAHVAFLTMGGWAVALLFIVAGACALSAIGLWIGTRWGHRLALVVLTVNMVGDAANALARHDLRTLVGLPVAGALIAYLLSPGVREQFAKRRAAAERL